MYWQLRYLEQDKAFVGTSGLATIELPNKGLLGCIQLEVEATAGTTIGKRNVRPVDAIEKLELVVNGSQVVKSLTGEQVKALMRYQKMAQGQVEENNFYIAGWKNNVELFINLGRHYHDLDYMLDLGMVTDPELRITYDFTKTGHNGWTHGEAQSSPERSVICHLLRDAPITPKGYIKTSELYRFTNPVSKKENMTIPRGPIYSNIYLQSFYRDSGIRYTLDTMEVNLDNDRVIPMRVTARQLFDLIEAQWGRLTIAEVTETDFVQPIVPPLEMGIGQAVPWGEDIAIHIIVPSLDGDMWYLRAFETTDGDSYTTAKRVQIAYDGILPHSLAAIPIFDPWDERTWVDSSKLGDFHVRYEGAATGNALCTVKLLGDAVVTSYL